MTPAPGSCPACGEPEPITMEVDEPNEVTYRVNERGFEEMVVHSTNRVRYVRCSYCDWKDWYDVTDPYEF